MAAPTVCFCERRRADRMPNNNSYKVNGAGNKVTSRLSKLFSGLAAMGFQINGSDEPFTIDPFNQVYVSLLSEKQNETVKIDDECVKVSHAVKGLFKLVSSKDKLLAKQLVRRYKQLWRLMKFKKVCDTDIAELDKHYSFTVEEKDVADVVTPIIRQICASLGKDAEELFFKHWYWFLFNSPLFSFSLKHQKYCLTQQLRGDHLMVDFGLYEVNETVGISITIHSGQRGCSWDKRKITCEGKAYGGPRHGETLGWENDRYVIAEAEIDEQRKLTGKTHPLGEYRFANGRWLWRNP
jgi:hypothetical protein